jgi:hypothetical protein
MTARCWRGTCPTRRILSARARGPEGLGRHHVGSNFFWYLKDPARNFSEYYSDLDCIVDDALWEPGVCEGANCLFDWGPPSPPSSSCRRTSPRG